MTDKKEIKKYCSGLDCLTCDEAEPCIYRIANKLQEQLKRKEQECEELKRELQAQRDFTAHEQKLIYCVAYDETCKTGNDCKQGKCIFKDNIKLKQALDEIRQYRVCEINDVDGEEGDVILEIIDEVME